MKIDNRLGAGLLGAFLLAAGGALAQGGVADTAQIEAGRVIAQRDCGGCHAVGPAGDSPLAAAPHFRDLHHRYEIDSLSEALAEGIIVGHSPMPERSYPEGEVRALILYLKSLETDVPKPVAEPKS